MIVPPNMWFHQHFNTGTDAGALSRVQARGVSIRNAQGVPKAWISRRVGGDQIDYADETPLVRDLFKSEVAKRGVEPKMDAAYEAELETLPPKPMAAE